MFEENCNATMLSLVRKNIHRVIDLQNSLKILQHNNHKQMKVIN